MLMDALLKNTHTVFCFFQFKNKHNFVFKIWLSL
jgi:hypothetical protein